MADVLSPVVGSAANKPNLFLETYGVSYGLDIFALGHNAVRRDLNDIYDVLYAFELRRGDVHLSDVAEFFKWFKPVAKFIRDIFELEERLIFPWVTVAAPGLQGEVGSAERLALKARILDGIQDTEDLRKSCQMMAPMGTFRKLLEGINSWATFLLEYFQHEEGSLPGLIEEEYSVEEKIRLDQRIVEHFLEDDKGGIKLYNLTRWMDAKQLSYWKESNLSYKNRIQFKSWEMQFKKQANIRLRILRKSGIETSEMETKQTIIVEHEKKKELRKTWAQLKQQVEKEEEDRVRNEVKNIKTEIGANVHIPQVMKERKIAAMKAKQAA